MGTNDRAFNPATRVEQAAQEAFDGGKLADLMLKSFDLSTRAIMQAFSDLGKSLGFKIAASRCPGADPGWKYDLMWFCDDGHGITTRIPLVLESELGRNKDDDFLKVVDSRAEVRVWLTGAASIEDAHRQIAACVEQIRRFTGSVPGDTTSSFSSSGRQEPSYLIASCSSPDEARCACSATHVLGDLDVLRVACARCGRSGRYYVDRLIAEHGREGNIPDWLNALK